MITKHACPCCGYKTFDHEPDGSYDICEVCYWKDDSIQLKDVFYEGGANRVSLRQAQKNFELFGACEKDMITWVRRPAPDEARDENWKPMRDLDVRHYLGIYQRRLEMQEDGITNPTEVYKQITRTIVEKLSKLPLDEKIILGEDMIMKDSKGNVIIKFPRKSNEG